MKTIIRKILGGMLVGLPFVILARDVISTVGWEALLALIAMTLGILVCFAVGVVLLTE